ncbi:inositol monophosphatase family protein [Spongorhabdus nitratireducens]
MSSELPVKALEQRYDLARSVIKQAGAVAFDFFQNRDKLQIESKAEPQDVVSLADREVEQVIRQGLIAEFSGDGFLGEEQGLLQGDNDWTWVVDPIDGTACFLTGMHAWCLSIGLMYKDQIVAGLVYDPNADELFSALKGRGCFVNDASVQCLQDDSLKKGLVGVGTSHRVPPEPCTRFLQQLLEQGGMFIRNGSGALMMSYVAAGRLIGYYEPHINSWDCLAGILLVQEAGGYVNHFLEGEGLQKGNPILASGPGVKAELETLTDLQLN